jgi:hypothetical protein
VVVSPEPQAGIVEDRRIPALTLDAWRRFVDDDPLVFHCLSNGDWKALDGNERMKYDDLRLTYHSELIVLETSTVKQVMRQGRLLTILNKRESSARRGLIVSGEWATGKSTAIKQLGRAHELRIRNQYSDPERIPVVYITAPPKGSPKKLAAQFARFLGMPPFGGRANEIDIADAVCQVLTDARTDLVIVDWDCKNNGGSDDQGRHA